MAAVSKRSWVHNGETKTAWIVRYRDGGGANRQKTFERKKEADAYRIAVEAKSVSGELLEKPPISVRALAYLFSEATQRRFENGAIGRSRRDNLEGFLRDHIVPYLGAINVSEITPLRIEDWANTLRRAGNRKTGKGLAPGTIQGVLAAMSQLEGFAIKHGYLKVRVMERARKEIGPLTPKPIRTFTVAEVQTLLQKAHRGAAGQGLRDRKLLLCYVYLATFCGMRSGEISGLKGDHIDFERRVIRVRHNLTRDDILKGPKTEAGIRDIPMPDAVEALLRDWLTGHYVENDDRLAFTTTKGRRIFGPDFNHRWNRLRAAAGLNGDRNLHFHALRHFAASFMIEHEMPLPEVARMLGHKRYDTTLQIYAHPVREVAYHSPTFERMVKSVTLEAPPERYANDRIVHRKPPVVRMDAAASAQGVRITPDSQ